MPGKRFIRFIEGLALRGSGKNDIRLPEAFRALAETVILWPLEPDETAFDMASESILTLRENIKAIVSFSVKTPFEAVEIIGLDKTSTGPFGYPKKAAARKLDRFTASIDLSPKFGLPLSVLPLWAGIELRIGRDESHAGDAYNIIIPGNTGLSIKAIAETIGENE